MRDSVGYSRVAGDDVIVWLRAHETGGAVQTFRCEYTVRNGVITAGKVLTA